MLAAGELAQIGTPREIYTQPSNTYVAARLGSPPINLLPATVLAVNAPTGTQHIGIRPEDLIIGKDLNGITADIIQVEHLGAETVVVLALDGTTIHALADANDVVNHLTPGSKTQISARWEAALYFDQHGQRLEKHS